MTGKQKYGHNTVTLSSRYNSIESVYKNTNSKSQSVHKNSNSHSVHKNSSSKSESMHKGSNLKSDSLGPPLVDVIKDRQRTSYRSKKDIKEDEEQVLSNRKQQREVKQAESQRVNDFRRKQYAAMRIQKAWRNHKMRSFAILLTAKQAVHKMRLRQGAEEFHKQIAALTIQLAWRKYIRRKLLQSLHPNKRQLRMWDPELIAMKQRALVSQIYGEQIDAPFWHPNMLRPQRPYWAKLAPSSAAMSYNFAIDQYHPLVAKKGIMPSPFLDEKGHPKEFLWQTVDEEELQGQLNLIKLNEGQGQSKNYSYNMRKK